MGVSLWHGQGWVYPHHCSMARDGCILTIVAWPGMGVSSPLWHDKGYVYLYHYSMARDRCIFTIMAWPGMDVSSPLWHDKGWVYHCGMARDGRIFTIVWTFHVFYMFLLHDYNLCFNGSPCYTASYYNYKSVITILYNSLHHWILSFEGDSNLWKIWDKESVFIELHWHMFALQSKPLREEDLMIKDKQFGVLLHSNKAVWSGWYDHCAKRKFQ